jgi:molybdenum cofactor cytidylyltransferase
MSGHRQMNQDQRPKAGDVVAILLAAGQSKRMGAFKPLLPFGETTVIGSCILNLRTGGVDNIVAVLGHRADEIRESLKDLTALSSLHLRFALNPEPESEMSASIACGVRELPSVAKAVLIALTDQPAIPAEIIKTVIDQWRSGAKLIIPEFQGRGGHPVLVDLSLRAELITLDPDRGLRSIFDKHRNQVRRVSVSSPFIARDMDTWEDYRALHEEVFGILPGDPKSSKAR